MTARSASLPAKGRWLLAGVDGQFSSRSPFPDGPESGPIFTARLTVSARDNVTAKTDRGLWALDSGGTLQLLLRTGNGLSINGTTRVVKGFAALVAANGSLGAARGYDDDQHVTVLASFANGEQAIVNIAIP